MPAARAAWSRLIPSRALASASRRALTRPSRSRRASARSSAGARPVVIGTATMARLPARSSRAKSWAAPTPRQDFLRTVSDVVVEEELVGVRPQPDRVDLRRHLVVDVGVDEVGREHVALEQELVVGLQRR